MTTTVHEVQTALAVAREGTRRAHLARDVARDLGIVHALIPGYSGAAAAAELALLEAEEHERHAEAVLASAIERGNGQ